MSIKQKITVGFGVLVAALLLLFSLFIYQTYESYRRTQMRTRLQRRALSAQLYLRDRQEFLRYNYLTLPEQHESLFDTLNRRFYSSSGPDDYQLTKELLSRARQEEVYFTYKSRQWEELKEGVALSFASQNRRYVAVITAYDLAGRQTSRNLRLILTVGNVLLLMVIALVGFLFARRAMRPFDQLISQLDSATVNDFSFRLIEGKNPDEASYLAVSFNQLLGNLQQLAASQENFVAYASHEIRTPLTVVKGMLETSLAYDQELSVVRQSMEQALSRLEGAIDLANSLLRLAEVEGLKATQLMEDVNVVDTILDTVTYFKEKYPQQDIELQLTDEFTEQSSVFRLIGNATLLRTALINIMDNAAKYSSFKPISVRVQYESAWIVIDVTDQGIGIPHAQLTNVFLPMMRAENVGRIYGFGLGLTLSKKIIDLHQGQLTLSSPPDAGTVASLRLPTRPL
ncbi:sensor histidine kinase [Spirosoma utsteinense]|uniref:histidine kinase n=1 Tax=Spirosoma utsteinense TaxID=2585773 RepID=A0ABR6W999_9BACT|nr:HAMP domain-containing sensor histidine kinase [Spirosoma utsteinense]MBC3787947.1 signal transduction histidine kinase [Spirosoma utsteinense]MBC3793148.1 signal transduction histidine kinase [Spirosoma utsteinense]